MSQQGKSITPTEELGHGEFGGSVALSSDGNTALIGGQADHEGVGAAWVFTRSGSTWTQQGKKVTESEPIGSGNFGASVALSSDGNTALMGGGEGAWVFTRSGSTWAQQGEKLIGAGGTGGDRFGYSVALSSAGDLALIGGPLDHGPVGAVWVFARSGSTWSQQGEKLKVSGEFGRDVALSSDGNTALIGGSADSGYAGAAWVFVTPTPPQNISLPAILGTPQVGQMLSCANGSWTGYPTPSFTYVWQRDGSSIAEANGATYVVQAADPSHTLTCQVTASNSVGTQAATSFGVAIPASSPSGSSIGGSSIGGGGTWAGARLRRSARPRSQRYSRGNSYRQARQRESVHFYTLAASRSGSRRLRPERSSSTGISYPLGRSSRRRANRSPC